MSDFDGIIDVFKENLTISDPESRNKTISNLLTILRENGKDDFLIQTFVNNGIIIDLISKVDKKNRRDVLECIQIIVETNPFYTNNLMDAIIRGITMYRLISSIEEAKIAVNIILTIITKVSVDFTELEVKLLIHKHEEGLLSMIERAAFDSFSMLSATKLLKFIVTYSTKDFKQTRVLNMKLIYSSTMEFLTTADGISDLEKLQIICCTSNSMANFCNEIDENELDIKLSNSSGGSSINQIPAIRQELIESIKAVVVKYLIPLAKGLEIEIETADTLINLLNTIIQFQKIKDKLLCIELLSQGYLRYLLQLSLQPERPFFRAEVCGLISNIIVTLKEYLELPIDDWPEDFSEFHSFICTGLASLPVDSKQWEDILKKNTHQSNSLLILLFCHFIGTEEPYIFTQESLGIRLKRLSKKTKPIFLKALWLLYSVAALSSKIKNFNRHLHSEAMKSLVFSLENQNKIELTYTHNVDLLTYSIGETNFPEKLRIKIISQWLDNSSKNLEFDLFIQKCLELCYDELKIIKLLMSIAHECKMKNLNNTLDAYESFLRFKDKIPGDVVEFVWKTLADDLSSYTSINPNILKIVLRITATLPTSENITACIMRKCAKNICKILILEDKDIVFKILLIESAAFTIRQSVVLADSKVAEIFLRDKKFLTEVYDSGLSFKNVKLTEVCIRTLTCLIVCQNKYNLQCKTISQLTFKNMETLLLDMRDHKCSIIFGIEFVKYMIINKIENPVIRLRRLENGSDLQHIYKIYLFTHLIHAEILPGLEDQTYQCLSTILNYCSDQKLNINVFLTCPSTPLLMEIAIRGFSISNRISYYFLDFTITWLDYVKFYRSDNKIRINGLPEISIEILVQFLPIVKSWNDSHFVIQDFITAISAFVPEY